MTYAVPYIRIYFLGMLPMMLLIWAAPYCALQAIRGPDCTAWRAGGVVNVILDFLFAAGFSGGTRSGTCHGGSSVCQCGSRAGKADCQRGAIPADPRAGCV